MGQTQKILLHLEVDMWSSLDRPHFTDDTNPYAFISTTHMKTKNQIEQKKNIDT